MAIFYDAATGGFYDDDVHAVIPSGAVLVSAARYAELLAGPASGLSIVADGQGVPQLVAAPPSSVQQRRDAARIDRGELCKALLDAGILSAASAVVAAKGDWPSEFDGFLAAMPESDRPSAQIDWAAATTVRYGNPLLQSAALAYVQGDATAATALLDSLFGVA